MKKYLLYVTLKIILLLFSYLENCSLVPKTTEENGKNIYDHNFEAKWCLCDSEYDPNIFMIRCFNCLDYYHIHHLDLSEGVVSENKKLYNLLELNRMRET